MNLTAATAGLADGQSANLWFFGVGISTRVKVVLFKYINILCIVHSGYDGYVLLEPRKAVKGLFVAVPQIERNRATQQRPPLKPKRLEGATDQPRPLSASRNEP
jgi:hypothetical protein